MESRYKLVASTINIYQTNSSRICELGRAGLINCGLRIITFINLRFFFIVFINFGGEVKVVIWHFWSNSLVETFVFFFELLMALLEELNLSVYNIVFEDVNS